MLHVSPWAMLHFSQGVGQGVGGHAGIELEQAEQEPRRRTPPPISLAAEVVPARSYQDSPEGSIFWQHRHLHKCRRIGGQAAAWLVLVTGIASFFARCWLVKFHEDGSCFIFIEATLSRLEAWTFLCPLAEISAVVAWWLLLDMPTPVVRNASLMALFDFVGSSAQVWQLLVKRCSLPHGTSVAQLVAVLESIAGPLKYTAYVAVVMGYLRSTGRTTEASGHRWANRLACLLYFWMAGFVLISLPLGIVCDTVFQLFWGVLLLLSLSAWVWVLLRFLMAASTAAKDAARCTSGRQREECLSAGRAVRQITKGIVALPIFFFWRVGTGIASGIYISEDFVEMVLILVETLVFAMFALWFAGAFSEALPAARGQCRTEEARVERREHASRRFRLHSLSGEAGWQRKVAELADRGISLRALLQFYRGLGREYVPHFRPDRHTTEDIVRLAIVPLSSGEGSALAPLLMRGVPTRPTKMVTHNWGNLFRDLVAAVAADALEEEEYGRVANLMMRDLNELEQWLDSLGRLERTYWICAFSVNQHCTICAACPQRSVDSTGILYPLCTCCLPKFWNSTPPLTAAGASIACEVNKFDDMMKHLASSDLGFEQVVAVDSRFELFSRAWCIAEMAAAKEMGMKQRLKFHNAEDILLNETTLRTLRIENMEASRPEDKEDILKRVPDPDLFNAELQRLLFDDLLPAWRNIDAMEQMRRLGIVTRWQSVSRRRGTVGIWSTSQQPLTNVA